MYMQGFARGLTGGFEGEVKVVSQSTTPFDNERSTADTIDRMVQLAQAGSRSKTIQAIANECLQKASKQEDMRGVVRCVYLWVKGHITFVEDEQIAHDWLGISYDQMNTPEGALDLVISPEVLVTTYPYGDCDCFSTLLASLLIALHLKVWFVSIKVDPSEPYRWSHVYVMTYLPDEQTTVALDASHGNYLGWEKTDGVFERKEWNVN